MNAFLPPPLLPSSRTKARRNTPTCVQSPPALSDVLVIGANRGLGAELLTKLSSTSNLHSTHRPCSAPSSAQTACSALDVTDRDAVFDVLASVKPKVIVSCFGGNVLEEYYPDQPGTKNLVDACEKLNVKRFVMISAMGAGDSEETVPPQVKDNLRPLLMGKSLAEQYVKKSSIDWTIVRPAPLVDGPSTDSTVLTEGLKCYGTTTRPGLAQILPAICSSEKAIGHVLHAVDRKNLLITAPYVRPLEFWEQLPFDLFTL